MTIARHQEVPEAPEGPGAPGAHATRPAGIADPQLNVILLTLGLALIGGAIIFSSSGSVPGLLFLLGGCLGLAAFYSRFGYLSRWRLLTAGVVAFGVGLLPGDARLTSVMAGGFVVGGVVALAATGTWEPQRITVRIAVLAGTLVGLGARLAIG